MFFRLRKMKIFLLVIFFLNACSSTDNNSAEGDYAISEFQVLVLDGEDDPIGDADVTLGQKIVSTNELGVIVFEDVSSGNYNIQVEADNYENYSVNISISKELHRKTFRRIS